MDVSARDLRNNTAEVIAAVQAGTPVTLTVHGRPVADIVPRRQRQEHRPAGVVFDEIERLSELAAESLACRAGPISPTTTSASAATTSDTPPRASKLV